MNDQWNDIAQHLEQSLPVLEALGDKTRQEIIITLATSHDLSVGDLAVQVGLSRPAVSHHLKILKQAGLLLENRRGTRRFYQPTLRAGAETLNSLASAIVQ